MDAARPPTSHVRRRNHRRRPLIIALVVALTGGIAAGAFFALKGGTPTALITGTFALTDDATANAGCVGQGPDSDLGSGATVTLSGQGAESIASIKLSAGTAANGVCTYRFEFPRTRANLSAYSVKVGSRPAQTMTNPELRSSGWHFDLRYGPPTTRVTGTLELTDIDTTLAGCIGQGGYSDISAGATVVITDQTERIVGSGSLDEGVASDASCTYSFSIPDVRQDEQQYAVEISHRGKVVQSAAEMQLRGWSFSVSLGS